MKTTWMYIELMDALREELRRYLAAVAAGPLTEEEEKDLREWVADGNSVFDNPCYICDEYGEPMSFIDGCRADKELREEYFSSLLEKPAAANAGWDVEDEDMPFRQ
jgi:hypothetical protein